MEAGAHNHRSLSHRWSEEFELDVLGATESEHPVSDFDGWKQAFDSAPIGREKSVVRRYQVLRAIDDTNDLLIDLEFHTASQAEALPVAMRVVWRRVEITIVTNPQARIVEVLEPRCTEFAGF